VHYVVNKVGETEAGKTLWCYWFTLVVFVVVVVVVVMTSPSAVPIWGSRCSKR